MSTDSSIPSWAEDDSREFLRYGRFFVPERDIQIEAVCRVIPAPSGPCHLADLCCGEGLLSRALLEHFPEATIHAFDGSRAMVDHARATLAGYGDGFEVRHFDLADRDWRSFPWPLHAVVSSLAIHHLDDGQKELLFRDLAARLEPGGALVIADVIRPASEEGIRLAGWAWNDAVRRRAMELGEIAAYELFRLDGWNMYENLDADPMDKPSRLLDQLRWLEAAGLVDVDLYWMAAGHAIFGGRKPKGR
jgi:tRNA (cmo5U34)-methyltransferase